MLTVGAGLGYGSSGERGVPTTGQRRERMGEQIGHCRPRGRPESQGRRPGTRWMP